MSQTSFQADLDFLQKHGEVVVLKAKSGARIAVSAEYQARVMTSSVGEAGASLGWVNRGFIESGERQAAFNNYGGEDRFWLGPEGGQFSLWFAKGEPFELDYWQTPRAMQDGTWTISAQTEDVVEFEHSMQVTNFSGNVFDLAVKRRISLLDQAQVCGDLGISLGDGVDWVAYQSQNTITNTGDNAWTEETGTVSIWSLGMFPPAADTWTIVPFNKDGEGPVATSDYFGKMSEERLKIDEQNSVVLFHTDAHYRSKIGLSYSRSKPVAGSYAASENRLTIVRYSLPNTEQPYVNSLWEQQSKPFAGDVFNSYNHGGTTPGVAQDVQFYELESSSPAAFLAPGEALSHDHQTFHFIGDRKSLEPIAKAVLGISLDAVPSK